MENNEPRSTSEGQDSASLNAEPVHVEKKRTFWGRVRKVAALLLLLVLIFFFATGLFIQLPIFKRLVVNELISAVENSTNGTLTVGEIKGNILEGFVMEDVTLRLKTGTRYDSIPLVHVGKILANYSLWRWLKTNEIGVTSMTLEHPVIRFVKFQGDTMWNYNLLTKPVPAAPEGPKKPFTQIIELSRLVIQNGAFYMRDYNVAPKQEEELKAKTANASLPAIDWADAEVEEIDLASRFYARGDQMQSARVYHLGFIEKKSGFYVSHLQFTGYLDSLQAKIEDAKITTGHSAIGFSVEVARPKAVDLGHLSTTRHTDVNVSLKGPIISTAELKQFLPKPLGFLGGSPGIDLEANGEFGKLKIAKLDLDLKRHGNISIAGELDNLHHPDSLAMNVALTGKNLSNASLDEYVPGLHLPNLTHFGTITIPSITYIGIPLNFHTKFAAKSTGAGDASGDVKLDLRNHHIQYQAALEAKSFNVAALVPGDHYESSITAEAKLAGHGTNWKTMSSTIAVKTDGPSSFGDYKINSLDLAGMIDLGTITTDHLDAEVNGGPTVHVKSAMLGLSSESLPFRFDGTVDNLLLGDVISSQELNPARVDVTAHVAGSARNFDNVTGTAHARLYDLEYNGHALPDDTLEMSISDSIASEGKLSVRSELADIDIERRFRTGDLIRVIPEHVNALVHAIQNRAFGGPESVPVVAENCADSMDFDYSVKLKDMRPLADFLPQTFFLAQGTVTGNVQGCRSGNISLTSNSDSLSFILRERTAIDTDLVEDLSDTASDTTTIAGADTVHSGILRMRMHRRDSSALSLPKFEGTVPRIQAMPTSFHLALRNLSSDSAHVLDRLKASLDLSTDSVLRLGSALLFDPKISLAYDPGSLRFAVASLYNNELGIHLNGNARFPGGDIDLSMDTISVSYANPYFTPANGELRNYVWQNEGPAEIQFLRTGTLRIDTLNIVHPISPIKNRPTVQRMSLGGTISDDTVHAWAAFPSFNLEDLRRILPFNPNAKTFDFASYHGKIRDFKVSLDGTLENPEMTAGLFIDSMSYVSDEENRITFDSNYVQLSYRDENLSGTMHLHVDSVETNAPNGGISASGHRSDLLATIQSIPVVLALKPGPNYSADSARAATGTVSASIHATEFPLDVATPFLPPFREVLGTGDIDFTISGSRDHVQYAGQAFVHNGELLLAATNMWYLFGGPITFAHNALVLQNDSVRNIASDDPNGAASLNGSFTFNGFDITNFDLRLRSDGIMVLSDAAKESLPMAYGPVTISTGGQDFHFRNTFEEPWINGTIDILNANVTMPSTTNEPQTVTGEGVIYETIPRTAPPASPSDTVHIPGEVRYNGVASTLPTNPDDTLFPNSMKDIYRNDDGTKQQTVTAPEAAAPSGANPLAPSFVQKLRMDLLINTRGTAMITMPFGGATFGVLGAKLKGDLKPGGTLQIVRGDDLKTIANGGFDLSTNSSFTFLQPFTITNGNVKFQNDFANPEIEVTAEYMGIHHPPNGPQDNVKIQLRVTGSKDNPMLTTSVYEQFNGSDWELKQEPSQSIAQEDAVYFLVTGNFKSEVNNSTAAMTTLLPNIGGQMLANVLSNLTGSTSSQFAIQSASLNLGTKGAQVTAAYKDITLKLAGGYSSANGTSTTSSTTSVGYNFETDIPLSAIPLWASSKSTIVKNSSIQLQYNQNPTSSLPGSLAQQPIFLAKFLYNIPLF